MKLKTLAIAISTALGATLAAGAAHAAGNEVVIGDIDDLSSLYADVVGQGGIEAAKMAIADFGGSVLGKKIVLLTTDHQNKPDIGASKFREWADQNGLTMVLGGSNTGVSIAMAKVAAAILTEFAARLEREILGLPSAEADGGGESFDVGAAVYRPLLERGGILAAGVALGVGLGLGLGRVLWRR